jgi:hypothetical protein
MFADGAVPACDDQAIWVPEDIRELAHGLGPDAVRHEAGHASSHSAHLSQPL